MVSMKARIILLTSISLVATLVACESGPLLRDDYMGQDLIEPELRPQLPPRDKFGNPKSSKSEFDKLEIIDGFWPRAARKAKAE